MKAAEYVSFGLVMRGAAVRKRGWVGGGGGGGGAIAVREQAGATPCTSFASNVGINWMQL